MNIYIKVILWLEPTIKIYYCENASLDHLLLHITKIISIDMTVATKDDFQDLTAEETTTPFIQSNISSGEELKSYNGLLEGKEYYIYR